MSEILLATLNAKFIHAAFGLRYLMANLGEFQERAKIAEFDINQRPIDIAEAIIAKQPRILGLGIYIWNAEPTREVMGIIRKIAPDITIVLGGPEVSYEIESQPIVAMADFVITGEADLAFAQLCDQLLNDQAPDQKIIRAQLPEPADLIPPYPLYTERDIANRIIYVEASRGCPFTCEFCLSSLDVPVRQVPVDGFLEQMQSLMDRGVRQFKFVDRTFNLNLRISSEILQFFLDRMMDDLFVHFEMIPDRLPKGLREIIKQFPPGKLQFEVGIQTFNPEVGKNISRRQNYDKLADNFKYLRSETGVHIHADLIVGLPGETLESFGEGFDRLIELGPQEIQVGILKRLKGTPIIRHDKEFEMVYSDQTPFEILQNRDISFLDMQRMRLFQRFWDLIGNSGNFTRSAPLIWRESGSPFTSFLTLSDWLFSQTGSRHGIALLRLVKLLFIYLTEQAGIEKKEAAETLLHDYQSGGRPETPKFLGEHLDGKRKGVEASLLPKTAARQARHLGVEQ